MSIRIGGGLAGNSTGSAALVQQDSSVAVGGVFPDVSINLSAGIVDVAVLGNVQSNTGEFSPAVDFGGTVEIIDPDNTTVVYSATSVDRVNNATDDQIFAVTGLLDGEATIVNDGFHTIRFTPAPDVGAGATSWGTKRGSLDFIIVTRGTEVVKTQSGRKNVPYDSGGWINSQVVTFPKPFKNVPEVTTDYQWLYNASSNGSANLVQGKVLIQGISKSGFSYGLIGGVQAGDKIVWIAHDNQA